MELQRITIWIILGTILLIQTSLAVELDNGGGGTWQETITFYLKSATAEYGHYKIVIDESACKIYNVMGDTEACQPNGNFWSLVQSDGEDIRVYNQSAQLYFWVEEWDYTNKTAVIWVNLSAGSEELNIAYGNPSATKSNYENGEQVFEFFDDFETEEYTVIRGDANQVSIVNNTWLRIDATTGVSDKADIIVELNKETSLTTDFIVEGKVYLEKPDDWVGWIVETNGNGYACGWYGWQGTKGSIERWDSWNNNLLQGEIPHYLASQGSIQILRWDRVGNELRMWDTDKSEVIATQTDSTYDIFTKIAVRCCKGSIWQIDWVRVLKLADPADFATEGGEPETNTTHIVSFKIYRCFKPVKNAPVKVKYKGKLVCCGYTDDTGSIAFRLDKLKTYEIDINKSEKIVTIQPLEHNYIITLPCNITMIGKTATYNQTFGNYTWDLLKIGQNISSQLSPSARGFLSGILAWLLMYGTSSLGLTSAVPGIIALAGLAVVGFTDWIVVLLCTMFSVGMYIIKRDLG